MPITLYQLITALVWGVATILLAPATLRAFSKHRTTTDEWKSALFFVGLLLVAFPSRWLIAPKDESSWKTLYVVGIALALYVLALLWNGRKR
jgi:hypothetical protein